MAKKKRKGQVKNKTKKKWAIRSGGDKVLLASLSLLKHTRVVKLEEAKQKRRKKGER